MKLFDKRKHEFTGWRRGGLINTTVLIVVTALLIGFLISAIVHGGGLQRSFVFLTTDCDAAERIDIGFHLLINAFSTAILASSNFFMQVLNAPSRAEVDKAHDRRSFLHIGVASWRNAFGTFGWKTGAWLVLALSSVPIHLVFNSAILVTDRRGSDYYLAIVADGFVHGEPYFVPGASLTPRYSYEFSIVDAVSNLSYAATNGAGWVRLDREACANEYITCRGLRKYRDLAIVIDRKGSGWARKDVWDFNDEASPSWDEMVPADQDNSLWYSAACKMSHTYRDGHFGATKQQCSNSCWKTLGALDKWNTLPPGMPDWTINFFPEDYNINQDDEFAPGLRPGRGELSVDYCLAEPDAQQCGVGVSNILLFIVVVCASTKVVTCVAIMAIFRDQNRLVTLGDAIESFIVTPDSTTIHGDGTLNKFKVTQDGNGDAYIRVTGPAPIKHLSNFKRAHSVISWGTWIVGSLPLLVSIALVATFISFIPDTIDSTTIAGLFSSDGHSIDYGFAMGPAPAWMVVVVNGPQIVFSLWYLTYNQVLTRLVIAKEWARFSTTFQPLRVTYPRGRQASTYFLELPYRYSVPLITTSIILHWLLSRSLYMFAAEGGYIVRYTSTYQEAGAAPEGTNLNVRFSSATLILVVSLLVAMTIVLVGLSFRKLPGYMPIVGTNSRRIAAACHVSPLSEPDEKPQESDEEPPITPAGANLTDSEIPLMDMRTNTSVASRHEEGDGDGDDEEEYHGLDPETARLTKISRGLLSWGIVRMPDEWYTSLSDTVPESDRGAGSDLISPDYKLEHMSFGTPSDNVKPPKDGAWYVFR